MFYRGGQAETFIYFGFFLNSNYFGPHTDTHSGNSDYHIETKILSVKYIQW